MSFKSVFTSQAWGHCFLLKWKHYIKKNFFTSQALWNTFLAISSKIHWRKSIHWTSCSTSKLEKQSAQTWTVGRKPTQQPLQRAQAVKYSCHHSNIQDHTQNTEYVQFWDGNQNLCCLWNLLVDIEAVTFGPYLLNHHFLCFFSSKTKLINTEICSKKKLLK